MVYCVLSGYCGVLCGTVFCGLGWYNVCYGGVLCDRAVCCVLEWCSCVLERRPGLGLGVCPGSGTPKKWGLRLRCGHSPKRGVLGAGTDQKKGGLRCGHN